MLTRGPLGIETGSFPHTPPARGEEPPRTFRVSVVPAWLVAAGAAVMPAAWLVLPRRPRARWAGKAGAPARHRLRTATTVCSAVVCAAVGVFWVRGLCWYDEWLTWRGPYTLSVGSALRQSAFYLSAVREDDDGPPRRDLEDFSATRYWTPPSVRDHNPPERILFPWFRRKPIESTPGAGGGLFAEPDEPEAPPVVVGHTVWVPHWVLLLATA